MTSEGLRHGEPESSRNERRGFDKHRWPAGPHWPCGLQIQIYDDGRVKVGGWHTSAVVLDVSSFGTGNSNASGHVVARFQPASGDDRPPEVTGRLRGPGRSPSRSAAGCRPGGPASRRHGCGRRRVVPCQVQRVEVLIVIPRGLADRFSRTEPDGATRGGGLLDHDGRASTQHAVGVS